MDWEWIRIGLDWTLKGPNWSGSGLGLEFELEPGLELGFGLDGDWHWDHTGLGVDWKRDWD